MWNIWSYSTLLRHLAQLFQVDVLFFLLFLWGAWGGGGLCYRCIWSAWSPKCIVSFFLYSVHVHLTNVTSGVDVTDGLHWYLFPHFYDKNYASEVPLKPGTKTFSLWMNDFELSVDWYFELRLWVKRGSFFFFFSNTNSECVWKNACQALVGAHPNLS